MRVTMSIVCRNTYVYGFRRNSQQFQIVAMQNDGTKQNRTEQQQRMCASAYKGHKKRKLATKKRESKQ